ncbi:hypothetical protein [Nitrososphaera sp.]|uniref:hypothetical protein n=1 Tax=Nitrososphaera sp. TaxID=1971748 RepID=UPI002ED83FD1
MVGDKTIMDFCDNLAVQNEGTAKTVKYFLQDLEGFSTSELQLTPTELIKRIKEGTATDDPKEEQVYRVLQKYAAWLKIERYDTEQNNARNLSKKLSWARTLFESKFIPISRTLYKQLVKFPKPEEPYLTPVDKKIVRDVIIGLDDPRLQSLGMWCASMGWRATESLSVRNLNLEGLNLHTLRFDSLPAFVNMSGKTAKTKKGKRRQLTTEMTRQIERLLAWKYRERTISRKENGKWIHVKVKPEPKPDDRVFTPLLADGNSALIKGKETKLRNAYRNTAVTFANAIDRLGIGYEENGKRRKVTLHTLRRFCFTTCTRISGESYAKYHIGRRIHEYDKRTPEQIAEDFATVEPFLTILDSSALEVSTKNLEVRLKESQEAQSKNQTTIEEMIAKQAAEHKKEMDALRAQMLAYARGEIEMVQEEPKPLVKAGKKKRKD